MVLVLTLGTQSAGFLAHSLSQVKDEINNPIEKSFSFRVKFVRNGVLFICRLGSGERAGGGGFEGGRAGGSKSFGRFHYVCQGVLITLVVGVASVFYLSVRLSSGLPGSRPHACLKAGTPHKEPTPAPTMKTLVSTTVNQRSMRAEAIRKASTFKIMARRVDWATLGAPRQHREVMSHPSSQVEAGTYHWCESMR